MNIHDTLPYAIKNGEFELYFQPQVEIATGRLNGVEVLLRWNSTDFGQLTPPRFISAAEEIGLVLPLSEWFLETACHQAVAWQLQGFPELPIAVNLSAIQFRHGNLEQIVGNALDDSGLAPYTLELELSESALQQHIDTGYADLQYIHDRGVRLSLDDFTVNYSSLSYLKLFNIKKLKLKQSLVESVADNPVDFDMLSSIMRVAKSLNIKTIAEGVDNYRIFMYLHDLRCDEAQGGYFARPMSNTEFLQWRKSRHSEQALAA